MYGLGWWDDTCQHIGGDSAVRLHAYAMPELCAVQGQRRAAQASRGTEGGPQGVGVESEQKL